MALLSLSTCVYTARIAYSSPIAYKILRKFINILSLLLHATLTVVFVLSSVLLARYSCCCVLLLLLLLPYSFVLTFALGTAKLNTLIVYARNL